MSGIANLEPERISSTGGVQAGVSAPGAGKMYPMDLAVTPQKITILKSTAATGDNKLHLVTPQGKPHLLSHAGPISLVRPSPQIISQGVASQQPQMIVSGSQLLPGGQIMNQSSQIFNQSQIIGTSGQLISPQTQMINQSGQIINPGAQIISQGSQIINQGSQIISQDNQIISQGSQIISQGTQIPQGSQAVNQGSHIIGQANQMLSQGSQIVSQGSQLTSQTGPGIGTQVLSVGSPLVGVGGVVVSSAATLRSLGSGMRVLPPSTHSSPRSGSSVSMTPLAAALTSKPTLVGVSSHVPRGPAAGASLAVPRASARPTLPSSSTLPVSSLGGWSGRAGLRGPALVYPARGTPRGPAPRPAATVSTAPSVLAANSLHSQTPVSNNAVSTSTVAAGGGISPISRIALPRTATPRQSAPTTPLTSLQRHPTPHLQAPRASTLHSTRPTALPVLQRSFQPTKVLTVGPRAPAPVSAALARSALYYEVTRTTAPLATQQPPFTFSHAHSTFVQQQLPAVSMTVVPVTTTVETRIAAATSPAPAPTSTLVASALARPSILRKRDIDGSPSKSVGTSTTAFASYLPSESSVVRLGWSVRAPDTLDDQGGDGGSTTVSAASSPAPDDDLPSPPRAPTPPTPVPHDISPRKKPRKQMLSSEVRNCEFQNEEPPPSPPAPLPPPPRRSLLGTGWSCGYRARALHFTRPSEVRRREPKPPHVLELANEKNVLTKANGWKVHHLTAQIDDLVELESTSCDQLNDVLETFSDCQSPNLQAIMELVKCNMQRSKTVCNDMVEAREEILRVMTHRTLVADILARQADKRCFRKHRTTHT